MPPTPSGLGCPRSCSVRGWGDPGRVLTAGDRKGENNFLGVQGEFKFTDCEKPKLSCSCRLRIVVASS